MKGKLSRYRINNPAIKFNMGIHVTFQQETDETITTFPPIVFLTEQFELYPDNDLDDILKKCSQQLQNRIICYEGVGSGWTVKKIHSLDTTVWVLNPLRGESYHPLSAWIIHTRCVVNVKNEGNQCFVDAVMACLYTPKDHVSRPSSYKKFYEREDAPTFESLTFPMKLSDVAKFEKDNADKGITVHVYGVNEWRGKKSKKKFKHTSISKESISATESISTMSDGETESEPEEEMTEEDKAFLDESEIEDDVSMYRKIENDTWRKNTGGDVRPPPSPPAADDSMRGFIYPIRISPEVGPRHINLLLTEKDGVSHYSSIKNLDGFLRAQYSKTRHKHFHCHRCLHGFYAKKGEKTRDQCKNLQEHMNFCKTLTPQVISFPKNKVPEFTNFGKMVKVPVVCYADF